MKTISLRHPHVMATLAGSYREEAATLTGRDKATATRRAKRCEYEGISAAIALALNVPGVAVNPHH